MKLQVEQAKGQIGKSIPYLYTVPAKVLGDVHAFPWSRHDITISGEFRYNGQNIIVVGEIETRGIYPCSRCTATVEHCEKIPFEEIFYNRTDLKEDGYSYDDDFLDLTELIRETLIINEPYQVLCQEDCKGLCVRCGVNLNHSQCECDSFAVDPRWAELRALLKKDD